MANVEYEWLQRMERLKGYNRWLFSHIEAYLGDSIWEAGAGIGTYSTYMTGAKLLVLSDIVDDYLTSLKAKFDNFKNVIIEKINLVNDDYKKLEDHDIDTVVCVNVLEHIDRDFTAMKNIHNVLRKGGRFLFIGPNHPFLYGSLDVNANHFRRYRKRDLVESMEKIGFQIEKVRTINFLAALTWFLQSRILEKKIISAEDLELCEKFVPLAKFIDRINPFPVGSNLVIISRK